jgi:hypothetical protein
MPLNGVPRNVTSMITMSPTEAVNALVQVDGDLYLQSNAGVASLVELQLFVDGVAERTVRTTVNNFTLGNNYAGWNLHLLKPLAAGTHTFIVQGRVIVGANTTYTNSGHISIVLFKQ